MFIVVFRNRKRADIDRAAYDAQAEAMEVMARTQPGFLAFKSFTAEDGEVISISEWESEGHARAWGCAAEHREAQADGRARWYAEYTIAMADVARTHTFTAKG